MDETLKRLEAKIDKLDDKLDNVDKTLVKQQVSLDYHVHRTNLLEESISILRNDVSPVEDHVKMMQNGFKIVGVLGTIISIVVGILKIIKFF